MTAKQLRDELDRLMKLYGEDIPVHVLGPSRIGNVISGECNSIEMDTREKCISLFYDSN